VKIRSRARMVALQALFEIDCVGHDADVVLDYRLADSTLPPNGQSFIRVLVRGVLSRLENLDRLIAKYAPEWPVDQMSVIDRNILRIAIYEIGISENTPVKVAINEAVELAKIFGSGSSRRFVNGVLGSLVAEEGHSFWKEDVVLMLGEDSVSIISEMG
jgi:N utilization substance protein B